MSSEQAPSVDLAARLNAARLMRGMTQQELAVRSGVNVSSISHFERHGRLPSFGNLLRLARGLGVSSDYLSGISDELPRWTSRWTFYSSQGLCVRPPHRDLVAMPIGDHWIALVTEVVEAYSRELANPRPPIAFDLMIPASPQQAAAKWDAEAVSGHCAGGTL